tara:strand:- start:942 stop:3014 length:2073 start_codon:yes stop_codon:yes gene_type:complete
MDSYLKLASIKDDNQNCNCIIPFYMNDISGINPNTNRNYSKEDKDAMKTALYRVSNAKGCKLSVCCDPNDPTTQPDAKFTKNFVKRFPKIMPLYERNTLISIKLSTKENVSGSGWITPSSHMICKLTKASIEDTEDPTIKIAQNLVNDCFTNQCSNLETITLNNLLQNSKADMTYSYMDDARVSQAIREGNITYVKEYIKKYKDINLPLTNDDYSNRMIHIASESKNTDILSMLIALKANINIKNKLNETPIHFAVRNNNIDTIDILLSQGADLNSANIDGEIPLFYAMKTGNLRIVKMLYNNNSPILSLDKKGNNLIHYCIKHCPSFKNKNDNNNDLGIDDKDKSNIIKFLIERGIDTEQVNLDGLTPLELTEKEMNREINKECAEGIENDNNNINEHFFNMKPNKKAVSLRNRTMKDYTEEHKELLEIQTLLFNTIIRNNPNKYNNYISVDDIPKGAPIEVLDTVCVGNNVTGNEDSIECENKGGQLVKIKNSTTKIKIELLPEDKSVLDKVDEKELYFKKQQKKIPVQTIPNDVSTYNNYLSSSKTINVPNTQGITYNLGETSNNEIDNTTNNIQLSNQDETQHNQITEQQLEEEVINNETEHTIESPEHPPNLDEYDDFVHKCKRDALRNSETIEITQPQTTKPPETFIQKYKTVLIIIGSIITILLIIIMSYYIFQYMKNYKMTM